MTKRCQHNIEVRQSDSLFVVTHSPYSDADWLRDVLPTVFFCIVDQVQ